MPLDNLFDFFEESESDNIGNISSSKDPVSEDKFLSRFIPPDIASDIVKLGPEYKIFSDCLLAVKGIGSYKNLDEKIEEMFQGLPNTKKSYSLQKSVDLEKFYSLLIRHDVVDFKTAIKKSSYKENINSVVLILEYLISYYLVPEKYEECAEIKKYIDFLLEES